MCHLSLPPLRGSGNGEWQTGNDEWKMKIPRNLSLTAYEDWVGIGMSPGLHSG
jgi:hypothetical protein